ncbi:MAG: carboxylesterase family protein [Bacteroidales bacterium]|nr:carboxylesterase family protein [Candidatus Cryptobacteroides caccocaballi]
MKKTLLFVMAAFAMIGCSTAAIENPVLTIEGGKVQGVVVEEMPGVIAYKGLPYAASPIRDLRWKAPQPVQPWEGVKIADTFGHPSFQSTHYEGGYTTEWGYGKEQPYSEDCLYANVWTKAAGKTDAKLPVALWIHGGGYREGWGSEPEFYAEEWAAKDVVLVSINYRLGVFGFLAHPELNAENPQGVSGNYGILDQIEALKWIKKNIAQFGGDPDNVTIFGQSAGGGSVRTLCESPLARGLFHKAIIMSAGGLNPVTPANAPVANNGRVALTPEAAAAGAKELMDWAGLTDLQKMRAASTEEIFALANIYNRATGKRAMIQTSPMVEGYVCRESFDDAARNGHLADVPYMIGYTMNDMRDMTQGIIDFCADRQSKGAKAWAYEFARPLPDDGSHPEVTARLKGAFHSSDLWFVFKTLKYCWRPWTQGDYDLAEKMLTAWTNFAKYSDPSGPGNELGWTPCTAENPDFMVFCLDANDAEASHMGSTVKELGY